MKHFVATQRCRSCPISLMKFMDLHLANLFSNAMEAVLQDGNKEAVDELLRASVFQQEELDTLLHQALQLGQASCAGKQER